MKTSEQFLNELKKSLGRRVAGIKNAKEYLAEADLRNCCLDSRANLAKEIRREILKFQKENKSNENK